jgi:3-deoxy-D-manno-octulosonate 8-phosphate phosphatase (KDO 8-P phosphatase)
MEYLKHFAALGTRFLRPPDVLQRNLGQIRALLFDWDGVFNDGWRDASGGSPFSEVGSMGVNLLRFALWQRDRKSIPCGVITGQHNTYAEQFTEREKFNDLFMGFTNKPEAFDAFLQKHKLDARQVAFFFDDILDMPIARRCGFRVMIRRRNGPLFENHVAAKGDADLLTHFSGGENGLREACELLVALSGRGDEVIEHRIRYSDLYQEYLADRTRTLRDVVRNPR